MFSRSTTWTGIVRHLRSLAASRRRSTGDQLILRRNDHRMQEADLVHRVRKGLDIAQVFTVAATYTDLLDRKVHGSLLVQEG